MSHRDTKTVGPASRRCGFAVDYLFERAWDAAWQSPDLSVQNGAVIVTAGTNPLSDCNRLTLGMEETHERLARPLKYVVTEHAERNVIYSAARRGIQTQSGVMVALWAACADCARAIVQSGIKELIRHGYFIDASASEPHWLASIAQGDEILLAGGVTITRYDGPINTSAQSLRFAGKEILPW